MADKKHHTAIETTADDLLSLQPFPNSHKRYISGSRNDIQVGMREIHLSDTQYADGRTEANAPL
ncbi:MAG: hypothetical protein ABNH15_08045, partial [Alcanivorax sp.]